MRIRHWENPGCSDGDSPGARVEKKLVEGWCVSRGRGGVGSRELNGLCSSGIRENPQGVDHETRRMNKEGH